MDRCAPARRRAEPWLIALVGLACLLPFAGKAFHIDDPMYIWAARQVQRAPLDFYGLEVNWHGQREPMASANKNPPLVSFWIALVAAGAGFGEVALHLGMALPALGALLATRGLAARLCAGPRTAALVLLSMPAFLVSATTLMADVPMLALWCLALLLWVRGLEEHRGALLLAAGVVAGLCALTKYLGLALVPLLLAYSLARQPRSPWWAPFLLPPLAIVLGFDAFARARYGESPLAHVGGYALAYRASPAEPLGRLLIGLSFLGGSLLTGLFFAPLLWSRRALLGALVLAAGALVAVPRLGPLGPQPLRGEEGTAWLLVLQLVAFAAVGVHWLALAIDDARRRRDAGSLLLGLWLGGVFAFATLANWTTNARALLPAAPAAAILLVRRLEARRGRPADNARALLAPLAPALAAALAVAWADQRLADSARTAARELSGAYRREGATLWFEGAWGFQYYMEAGGGRRIDWADSQLAPGDTVLVPVNNTNVRGLPARLVTPVAEVRYPAAGWIATLAAPLGAGFYSDRWGPLPFALGRAPPETYYVLIVDQPIRIRQRGAPPAAPPSAR